MAEPLRVAVVGLGFGQAHLGAYRGLGDRFEVAAICDHTAANLDRVRRWLPVRHAVTSFEELLDLDGIDVIDICTPPVTHVAMAEAALLAGLDVICEKPLTPSLAEVDRLAEIEAASSGRLMPIFQYRFGNGVARLERVLRAGIAGRPFVAAVETFWRRGGAYFDSPWRGRRDTELGGICAMHAIHAHDLLLMILGPVASVYARTAVRVNDVETEDCAAAVVEFESGALATLTATLGSAREMSRMRLHFEHLSVESGLSPYTGGGEPWIFEPTSSATAEAIDEVLADFEPGPELLDRQLAAFADARTTGHELPVTIASARPAIELLTAIYASAARGEPVDLPIGADDPAYQAWSMPVR